MWVVEAVLVVNRTLRKRRTRALNDMIFALHEWRLHIRVSPCSVQRERLGNTNQMSFFYVSPKSVHVVVVAGFCC